MTRPWRHAARRRLRSPRLERMRADHAHSHLGFSDAEVDRWCQDLGLSPPEQHFPPDLDRDTDTHRHACGRSPSRLPLALNRITTPTRGHPMNDRLIDEAAERLRRRTSAATPITTTSGSPSSSSRRRHSQDRRTSSRVQQHWQPLTPHSSASPTVPAAAARTPPLLPSTC